MKQLLKEYLQPVIHGKHTPGPTYQDQSTQVDHDKITEYWLTVKPGFELDHK